MPPKCIWKSTETFQFRLRKPHLRKAAKLDANHNFLKAKRLWKEGKFRVAKKNLVHGVRYFEFANQLLAGQPPKFEGELANSLWREIDQGEWSWEELERKFKVSLV